MREQMEHHVRNIAQYVEGQARGEEVEHAERMMASKILGTEHEVWDVRTDRDRYWVVTSPTNLYSQSEFKSADYALTFHVGLALRMAERSRVEIDDEVEDEVDVAWRKYEQAAGAFNTAHEAEDFQAVGVRCREALIALGRKVASELTSEAITDPPKANNFKGWADIGAERFATGRLRSYLKMMADKTWDLTVWLQHYDEANPWDAELVLDATQHTIATFGMAMHRHKVGAPPRCPRCASYRVEEDSDITEDIDIQWTEKVCGACEHRWNHRYIRLDPIEGWVETDAPPGG